MEFMPFCHWGSIAAGGLLVVIRQNLAGLGLAVLAFLSLTSFTEARGIRLPRRWVHRVKCERSTKRQTRREAGAQSRGPLLRRGRRATEWSSMGFSGYTNPTTSEHSRRVEDKARIFHEGHAFTGHVEQEVVVIRSYERFLEMPVAFVLSVMWAAGVALLGSCAVTLYLLGSLMLQLLT